MNKKQAMKIEELYTMGMPYNTTSCRIIQASHYDGKYLKVCESGKEDDIAVLLEYKREDASEFFPSSFLRNKIDFKIKLFTYSDLCASKGFLQMVLIV